MNPEAATSSSSVLATAIARDRKRSFRRQCCVTVLRRYFNVCVELGRLPSLLGSEYFAARRGPRRRPHTFEDAVIFSIDVERCLDRLDSFERDLVARLVLQEHSEEDAARLLHCCRETLSRRLPVVLDKLADLLIERGLLKWRVHQEPPPAPEGVSIEACDDSARRDSVVAFRDKLPLLVEISCQAPYGGQIHATA